jgi:hypothetical protein
MPSHNFNIVSDPIKRAHYKVPKGYNLWWCNNCDTAVIHSFAITKHMVNQLMTKRLACLPPVTYKPDVN